LIRREKGLAFCFGAMPGTIIDDTGFTGKGRIQGVKKRLTSVKYRNRIYRIAILSRREI